MSIKQDSEEEAVITIAIMDKDVATREDVAGLFRSSSYKVEEFESKEQLLTSSTLSDMKCLMLSPEPTYSATKKLINSVRKQNSSTVIIAIGNNEDLAQAVTTLRAGADDYICKPLNSGKVRMLVHQLLAK